MKRSSGGVILKILGFSLIHAFFLSIFFNPLLASEPVKDLTPQNKPALREISLKLTADEELSSIPGSKKIVETALIDVSREFESLFKLKFRFGGWSEWKSDDRLHLVEDFAEVLDASTGRGKFDILVAVTAQENIELEHTGFSMFKSGTVVVIFTPDRVKLGRLLKHEFGHIFGAVHVPVSNSVMSCPGDGDSFDTYNRSIIQLARTRSFKPFDFPFPEELLDQFETQYLRIRDRIKNLKSISRLLAEPLIESRVGIKIPAGEENVIRCLSDCFLMLAQLELEKHQYQKMIEFCDEALRLGPDDTEAMNMKAIALRRTGEIEKAVAIYQEILKKKPDSARVLFNLGIAHARANRLEEAEKVYEKTLAIKPDFIEAHNNLGEIYLRQGRTAEAEKELLKAVAISDEFPLALSNLAEVYLRLKDIRKAKEYVEKALTLDPKLTSAHNIKGNILRQEGRLKEAVIEYQKALERDPNYEKAYYNLGVSVSDLGKWEEAREYFVKAIGLNPNFGEAYAGLGLCALQAGKWDEAIENLWRARELGYRPPAISVNLSYAYIGKRDWEKAEEEARRAVAEQPSLALAYNNLAVALAQQNEMEEARTVLEKSLEINSLDRDAVYNLATVELSLNNQDRALELFLKALALSPEDRRNGLIYNNVAVIYFKKGKYQLSWEFCQKALQAGFKVNDSFIEELKKKIKEE
jgi:tetratricopeptide (TPR) repeat protein